MNITILQGRPAFEPRVKKSVKTGRLYCRFRLIVDRPYKGRDVPKKADGFWVVCFGKTAQTVHNNLAKGAFCTILGELQEDKYQDKTGNMIETVVVIVKMITIHEWLKKHRPLEELSSDFDVDPLIPREITDSLIKQITFDDEDIPDDLAGEIDDIL